MFKGNCSICDRKDVMMATKASCSSCYTLVRRFNGDIDKAREYRRKHPIQIRHANKKASGVAEELSAIHAARNESKSKSWLDIQIEEAIARVLSLAQQAGNKKFTLELEFDIKVTGIKAKE